MKKDINSGSELSTLITNLRAYLQLSQAAFAEPLGLSPTHIARFEKGISIPSQDTIVLICKAYQVNPEYFTETGMDLSIAVKKNNPEAGISERLESARQERGWSQNELAKRSDVNQAIINRVEFGAKLTEKQAVKLAEALEVGVDWLMQGDEKKKKYPADQKMILWLRRTRSLSSGAAFSSLSSIRKSRSQYLTPSLPRLGRSML